MKPIKILYTALVRLLIVCLPVVSMASTEPYAAKPLSGSQVRKDSSSTVIDTVYFNPTLKPQQTTFSVRNLITFKINEFANLKLPDTFTVKLNFKVYYTRDLGGTAVADSTADSLTINYDKGSFYSHKALYTFKGGHRVQVKITKVTVMQGTLADFEPALMLENELVVTREYQFSCTNNAVTALNTPVLNAVKGELGVSWNGQRAADEYDLEWTYIDDSSIANYYVHDTTVDRDRVFNRNATRVSITKTSYLVPLLYDGSGRLFFRVRAVQVKANGQRIESVWSTDYTNGLGKYKFTGHENRLNWQVSTSFAEEGKRKSVVQYFDGSLRNRQTVTKDNTTDTTIIAETFYDYQGRPAVQVLPSPSLSSLIKYTPNYNAALNGVEYDKNRYDGLLTDSCYCKVGAEAFDTLAGTAQYYSPQNPLAGTGFNKYIPDAKGFVFAETRYTPDNTDRVSIQSGVGAEFRIDSGRATRYFYSRADQEDLDALFGTDAGNSSHYFKNMVRDANGQYSISYVDMHGRTIATALAGSAPPKMGALASNQPYTITKNLIDSNTNIIKGTTIETSRGLVVTRADNHRFIYSLLPDSISIKACDSANICYDCSYDLTITITDECNNSSFTGGVPFTVTKSNLTIDTTCNARVAFPGVDTTVYLREGNYLVTKSLTISQKTMDAYREIFLRRNTCKNINQFITDQKALLSSLACEPSCAACTTALGTWAAFRPGYMTMMGIADSDTANFREVALLAYNRQLQECDELCNGKTMDRNIRDQMLADMTVPYGQYVDTARKHDIYSVFTNSETYGTPYTIPPYVNENNKPESPDPRMLGVNEFLKQFKPSWAEALLTQHPEYSKLLLFEQLRSSNVWDLKFEATETFKSAVDSGYLNPANFSGLPGTAAYTYRAAKADPLFTSLFPAAKTMMDDALKQTVEEAPGVYTSAWSLATTMAHCPDGDEGCRVAYRPLSMAFTMDTACSGELDIAWRYFRAMYLQQKRTIIDSLMSTAATLAGKNPVYYQTLGLAGHTLAFPGKNLAPAGNVPGTVSQATDSLNSFIDANCRAYAQQWWLDMKPCNFNDADSAAIIDSLIQVCREGGDAEHLFGASTVKPSSTKLKRSFEQVLKFFAGNNYNSTCNVYLIQAPLPYDNTPLYFEKPVYQKPDSCECATIGRLYDQYQAASADASFSDYIYRTTATRITNGVLDTLRKACRGEINCSFLKEPLLLPPVLQCGAGQSVCVTCTGVDTLYTRYKQQFPDAIPAYNDNDSLQRTRNILFERYMNNHLGFGKSTAEYLAFIDTCRSKVTSCDSLKTLLSNYKRYGNIPHLDASGADTTNWKVNFGGSYYKAGVPLTEIIKNGVLGLPDYYTDTLPDASPYNQVGFNRWYDSLCVDSAGFTFETRLKLPDTLVYPNGDNDAWLIHLYSNPATSGGILAALKLTANKGVAACTHQDDPLKVCTEENIPHIPLDDWKVVKLQFRGKNFKLFVADTLRAQRTLDAPMTVIRQWSLTAYSQKGKIDYIRIYDTSVNYLYREEFDDARNLAVPAASTDCIGCQATFTQYFNQAKGTSYTYSQIQALYTTCGVALDPCQDTLTPQLAGIKDGFMNNYYNHGRKYDNNGCDINTWKVNYGGTFANTTAVSHNQIFKNGIMQFPDTLRSGTRVDYDFFKNDTACVERHFSMEFRVKNPYYSTASNQAMIFTLWFGIAPNPAQKYYLSIGKTLGESYASYIDYTSVDNNRTYYNINELAQMDFSTWRVLKLEIVDSVLNYYLDGQLVKSLNFPAGIALENFYGFSVTATANSQKSASFDWIKAYNKNNRLFYSEDFNSCSNFSVFEPFIHCSQPTCTQVFTNYYNTQKKSNYNFTQLDSLYKAHGLALDVCSAVNSTLPTLCGRTQPVFAPVTMQRHTPCSDSTLFAVSKGTLLYEAYRDSLTNSFDNRYLAKCLAARYNETFTVQQPVSEYHYTLYYYDQSGSLVKTVPPQGVDVSKFGWYTAWSDSVKTARRNKQVLQPKHQLPTTYVYNTLNQVVTQQSPDGGTTNFWYDRLGRLAISQNARQKAVAATEQDRQYSFTQYDSLGRITEVGQVKNTSGNGAMTETVSRNKGLLDNWLWTLTNRREQITQTIYDLPYSGFAGSPEPKTVVAQRNLRNRVSYTSYTEGSNPSAYNAASFYTYDILGNVDTLLQDYGCGTCGVTAVYNVMNQHKNRTKKFTYQYDLISGKVNLAMYQLGWSDQWLHRYSYDAENRLTLVETSTDSLVWAKDARYEYYRHGPLARTVLGDQSVQGIDYAYTLQGWLKGVNSTGGTHTYDIGSDGKSGSLNQYTARDAYGFNLNYFSGDYKPVNSGVTPFPAYRTALATNDYRPLYNGNISSMGVYLHKLEVINNSGGILYTYQYDQLNRLLQQDAFAGFDRNSNGYGMLDTYGQTFREAISYDANGNIHTYNRNGLLGKAMDRLTYHYYAGTNQLKHVTDLVAATEYGTSDQERIVDIDNQPDSNYTYDAIGNLIKDSSEGNTRIKWNVYGKITEITRTPSVTANFSKMSFSYDAQGNRIGKVTTQSGGRMDYTWYVRDAQGNLITTYTSTDQTGANKDSLQKLGLTFSERHIYGSSRLGTDGSYGTVNQGPLDLQLYGYKGGVSQRGLRQYELTNHLGNVLSTISDKKFGVSSNGTTIDYYEPDIQSATDYYAFGMPSRVALAPTILENQYRYGFNGKENDWQAKGWMNQQDYGMRIYDPRLGRFLSVDPITSEYPELTPYQFASNSPIENIDLDGLEKKTSTTFSSDLPLVGIGTAASTSKVPVKAFEKGAEFAVDRAGKLLVNTGEKVSLRPLALTLARGGSLLVGALLTPLNAGVRKPEGEDPLGRVWGGDYYTAPQPSKEPLPLYKPKDVYNPSERPPKDRKGRDQYYVYETKRDHKQAGGLVPTGTELPYFGITSQSFSPGRYPILSVQGKGLVELIGVTNRYIAKGAETALMLLNSPGWSVINSTRIDNEMPSTTDPLRIAAGRFWLEGIDENWEKTFLRPENPKGGAKSPPSNDNNK